MKGSQIEIMAARVLEDQDYQVERARNKIIWIANKGGPGRKPISTSHDFFGCFDLLAVHADRMPRLVQVTTKNGLSARRAKLRAYGELYGIELELWGYWGGRGRHFRVFVPPIYSHNYREEAIVNQRKASYDDSNAEPNSEPTGKTGDGSAGQSDSPHTQ